MAKSVMDPPPNPHGQRKPLPMIWPLDADDYERLVDVLSLLRLLVDAVSGKRNSDGQVHLDQDGLACLIGKLADTVATVLENCDASREGRE